MPIWHHPKGSAAYINQLNKIRILHLIREKQSTSRAEIARLTQLSAPSVTRIVEDLIHNHRLVKEVGQGDSSGGRRPNLIQLNESENYLISVQFCDKRICVALANVQAEILQEEYAPMPPGCEYDQVLRQIADLIQKLAAENNLGKERIAGIGLAVLGFYNMHSRVFEWSSLLPWKNVLITEDLSALTGIPSVCAGVSYCIGIGENWFGKGRHYDNILCLNISDRIIGCSVIIDHDLFIGGDGRGIQIGHFPIDDNSEIQCGCGNYGCFQTLASDAAIVSAMKKRIQSGTKSRVSEMCSPDLNDLTVDIITQAAEEGDAAAVEIVQENARLIGKALVILINLFHPHAIFINGRLTAARNIFFDPIKEQIAARGLQPFTKNLEVLPTTFGDKSAIVGAISLSLRELLNLKFERRAEREEAVLD